jgi:hypothetical protein
METSKPSTSNIILKMIEKSLMETKISPKKYEWLLA